MVKDTDLYAILELDPQCSTSEIKKAYHKLARTHHPDKAGEDSHAKFQAIQGAYEILSDPEQRENYDRYGISGIDGGAQDGAGMHMNDLFASMFGGAGGSGFPGPPPGARGGAGSSARAKRKARGDDQIVDYPVTLEEGYTGKEKEIVLEKQMPCQQCKGSGCKPKGKARQCGVCRGQGEVVGERMVAPGFVAQTRMPCSECGGEGEKVRSQDACKKCRGKKTVSQKNRVNVYIDKGARDGDRIVLRGEGDQLPEQQPGDVILVVNYVTHSTFSFTARNSLDLQTDIVLTLSEALLGFDRLILTHLDGRGLRVKQSPPGQPGARIFNNGDTMKIVSEGYPKRKSPVRGDLILKVAVEMPSMEAMASLSQARRRTLEDFLPPKRPDIATTEVTDEVELQPVGAGQRDPYDSEDEGSGSEERSQRCRGGFDEDDVEGQPQCHQQ